MLKKYILNFVHIFQKNNKSPYIFFLLSCIASIITLAVLNNNCDAQSWKSWYGQEMFGSEQRIKDDYCENKGIIDFNKFILTPSNSISNLVYIFGGFLCISIAIDNYQNQQTIHQKEMTNQMRKNPIWVIFSGCNLIFTGIASFSFHASYVKLAHTLDIMGIFPLPGYFVTYSFANLFLEDIYRNNLKLGKNVNQLLAILSYFGNLYFGYNITKYKFSDLFQIVIWQIGLIVLNVILKYYKERKQNRKHTIQIQYVIYSLIFILLALLCQEITIKLPNSLCNPFSFFQFHSLWHIFSCLAILMILNFFLKEQENNSQYIYQNDPVQISHTDAIIIQNVLNVQTDLVLNLVPIQPIK